MPRKRSLLRKTIGFAFDALIDSVRLFLFRSAPERMSRGVLLDRARRRRRDKALQRWLDKTEGRGPIPPVGLHCPQCDFDLTGLTGPRCPECGRVLAPQAFRGD